MKILDLTHVLKNNMPVFPGTAKPVFEPFNTIEKDGFAELDLHICTHLGTHIDAPCHIIRGAKSLDEFEIERFIGKGMVIDCSQINAISVEFLKTFEKKIEKAKFILFYTAWQHKWNSPDYFNNFPVLSTEATEFLLTFKLKALGFDCISADKISDSTLPNHHLLLANNILIIENLTNLDKLINREFEFNCIPLKIEHADGSPVRAFARF